MSLNHLLEYLFPIAILIFYFLIHQRKKKEGAKVDLKKEEFSPDPPRTPPREEKPELFTQRTEYNSSIDIVSKQMESSTKVTSRTGFLLAEKLPRFDDRKRINIRNIDPFAIDRTPGLWRRTKPILEVASVYVAEDSYYPDKKKGSISKGKKLLKGHSLRSMVIIKEIFDSHYD